MPSFGNLDEAAQHRRSPMRGALRGRAISGRRSVRTRGRFDRETRGHGRRRSAPKVRRAMPVGSIAITGSQVLGDGGWCAAARGAPLGPCPAALATVRTVEACVRPDALRRRVGERQIESRQRDTLQAQRGQALPSVTGLGMVDPFRRGERGGAGMADQVRQRPELYDEQCERKQHPGRQGTQCGIGNECIAQPDAPAASGDVPARVPDCRRRAPGRRKGVWRAHRRILGGPRALVQRGCTLGEPGRRTSLRRHRAGRSRRSAIIPRFYDYRVP